MLPISYCMNCGKPVYENRQICHKCEYGHPEPKTNCLYFNDYFCSLTGEDCVKDCLEFKEDKVCTTIENI